MDTISNVSDLDLPLHTHIQKSFLFINDTIVSGRLLKSDKNPMPVNRFSNTGNTRLLANFQSALTLFNGKLRLQNTTIHQSALLEALRMRDLKMYETELPIYLRLEQAVSTQIPNNFSSNFNAQTEGISILSHFSKQLAQQLLRLADALQITQP